MKPVLQTRFGCDPNAPGNCFSAAVASILECTLADLPDEAELVKKVQAEVGLETWVCWPDRFKWGRSWEKLWARTQEECLKRGLFMLEVKPPWLTPPPADAWCIISAMSPRGILHSCVGRGERIVHDPHPSGAGVAKEDRTYIFFVALDPAARRGS